MRPGELRLRVGQLLLQPFVNADHLFTVIFASRYFSLQPLDDRLAP
jgi:hypothetical protein